MFSYEMNWTDEDIVQIDRLGKQGISLKRFSERYRLGLSNLTYFIRLIVMGEKVSKGENRYYSPKLKQEMMEKVFIWRAVFTSDCLKLRVWAKSLQHHKTASYQVFKNLDMMRFIIERLTEFSSQIEFLSSPLNDVFPNPSMLTID